MQPVSPHSEAITLVISEIVEPRLINQYEAWTKGINHAAQQFPGFIGVEVIRPRDHDYPEYVVIVKFDTYASFRNWITSSTYHDWLNRSHDFITTRSLQELPTGMELWFTLPKTRSTKTSQPAYYKQVIMGVITVYPLILLSNALLGPLLSGLPFLLSLFISVIFVSALLTYPVMPWLTKALSFWLYPVRK